MIFIFVRHLVDIIIITTMSADFPNYEKLALKMIQNLFTSFNKEQKINLYTTLHNSWASCCMKLSSVSQPNDFVNFLVATGLSLWKTKNSNLEEKNFWHWQVNIYVNLYEFKHRKGLKS